MPDGLTALSQMTALEFLDIGSLSHITLAAVPGFVDALALLTRLTSLRVTGSCATEPHGSLQAATGLFVRALGGMVKLRVLEVWTLQASDVWLADSGVVRRSSSAGTSHCAAEIVAARAGAKERSGCVRICSSADQPDGPASPACCLAPA